MDNYFLNKESIHGSVRMATCGGMVPLSPEKRSSFPPFFCLVTKPGQSMALLCLCPTVQYMSCVCVSACVCLRNRERELCVGVVAVLAGNFCVRKFLVREPQGASHAMVHILLGDPEVTANIYCKSRNLPNTDTQNYSNRFAVTSWSPSKNNLCYLI